MMLMSEYSIDESPKLPRFLKVKPVKPASGLNPFLGRAVQGRFQRSIKDLALNAVDEAPPAILFLWLRPVLAAWGKSGLWFLTSWDIVSGWWLMVVNGG